MAFCSQNYEIKENALSVALRKGSCCEVLCSQEPRAPIPSLPLAAVGS